jgi:drug/metabolite transporter (DMT)-like permease
MVAVFVRSAAAAGVLYPMMRPRLREASAAGALAYACTILLFVPALRLTTAATAVALQYTAPIFAGVFERTILGSTASLRHRIAVVCSVLGAAVCLCSAKTPGRIAGEMLALGSGIAYGLTIVLLRRTAVDRESRPSGGASVVMGNVIAMLLSAVFAVTELYRRTVSGIDVTLMITLGVFQLALPYAFILRSIQAISATRVTILTTLEAALNPLWVAIWLGEVPGLVALTGAALLVMASLLSASPGQASWSAPEDA